MISKDQAIIMQVAAKIAAELTIKSNSDANVGQNNLEATLTDWEMAFNYVNDKLQKTNSTEGMSNNIEGVMQAFPGTTVENIQVTTQSEMNTVPSAPRVSTVRVAGTQHGDLPNWLVAACQKAGVSKVWDNRDKAVGTKRPWFKQADAVDGQEPAAFWPPKGA